MKTFDDGTEEEFLIFKRDFFKSAEDNELIPSANMHRAKNLYILLIRTLDRNIGDEWLGTIEGND